MNTTTSTFEQLGFGIVPNAVDSTQVEILRHACCQALESDSIRTRRGARYGIRNLMRAIPAIRELTATGALAELARSVLGNKARPVKATFFNKVAGANWMVPWHQDVTIAVATQIDTPGFAAWSMKAGVVHVQPPAEILESMIAIRLHLDHASEDNGALLVMPESHRFGRMTAKEIDDWRSNHAPVICDCSAGDALIMRPLILHASMPSANPTHRRVIHVEYAACTLPNGLDWAP